MQQSLPSFWNRDNGRTDLDNLTDRQYDPRRLRSHARQHIGPCQGNLGRGPGDPWECSASRGSRQRHVHAYRNPIRVFVLDELTMLVGPDESASLFEIGIAHGEGIDFIVHAMIARPKFLE